MPAAACKGLRQTMSNTMALAVPLAVRLSCQRCKKPFAQLRQKDWPWGEFALSKSFAWRLFISLSFCYIISHQTKKGPSCSWCFRQAPRPKLWQLPVCSRWGSCVAEAGCQVVFEGFQPLKKWTIVCVKQTVPLCGRVWRPFEPWTKPAEPSLGLAESQTICQTKTTFSENKENKVACDKMCVHTFMDIWWT